MVGTCFGACGVALLVGLYAEQHWHSVLCTQFRQASWPPIRIGPLGRAYLCITTWRTSCFRHLYSRLNSFQGVYHAQCGGSNGRRCLSREGPPVEPLKYGMSTCANPWAIPGSPGLLTRSPASTACWGHAYGTAIPRSSCRVALDDGPHAWTLLDLGKDRKWLTADSALNWMLPTAACSCG